MIDHSRMGMRCRTTCFVRTVEGDLPRNSQGTIRCDMENLDRQLILVHWDRGFIVPVFPHEIEVCAEADARL